MFPPMSSFPMSSQYAFISPSHLGTLSSGIGAPLPQPGGLQPPFNQELSSVRAPSAPRSHLPQVISSSSASLSSSDSAKQNSGNSPASLLGSNLTQAQLTTHQPLIIPQFAYPQVQASPHVLHLQLPLQPMPHPLTSVPHISFSQFSQIPSLVPSISYSSIPNISSQNSSLMVRDLGLSTFSIPSESGDVSVSFIQDRTSSFKGKRKRRRQRSAFAHELTLKGYYMPDDPGSLSKIRVWVNERNMQYYDCDCGKRKPVQDLYKIKLHVVRHDVGELRCSFCDRKFSHHLQMNAHMKVHKREQKKLTENNKYLSNPEERTASYSSSDSQSSSLSPPPRNKVVSGSDSEAQRAASDKDTNQEETCHIGSARKESSSVENQAAHDCDV